MSFSVYGGSLVNFMLKREQGNESKIKTYRPKAHAHMPILRVCVHICVLYMWVCTDFLNYFPQHSLHSDRVTTCYINVWFLTPGRGYPC